MAVFIILTLRSNESAFFCRRRALKARSAGQSSAMMNSVLCSCVTLPQVFRGQNYQKSRLELWENRTLGYSERVQAIFQHLQNRFLVGLTVPKVAKADLQMSRLQIVP
eukprot:3683029-Amphidinium_carterae.1